MPLQMVDLTTPYFRIKAEMDVAIIQAVTSGQYINGEQVNRLAIALSHFLQVPYVIPCANGTDALQIALMSLQLQPGDQVIMPAFTYAAAAEAAILLGLVPVFVDIDLDTFNLDPSQLESAITARTKVVVPVHLFGMTCHMSPIMDICQQYGLAVIEDNAQSIGSVYTFPDGTTKMAGTMGKMGTLSFFPTKNLGCYGDGGALLTRDEALAKQIRMITQHGQSSKYHHEIIGCNSRLDTLQAAVLLVKLKYLSDDIEFRQKAANYYTEKLSDLKEWIILPTQTNYSNHVYHQYTIRVNHGKRNQLQLYLKENGIPSVVYYPLPLHHQTAYRSAAIYPKTLQGAELLANSVLSLPMHTALDNEQLDYIILHLHRFFNNN